MQFRETEPCSAPCAACGGRGATFWEEGEEPCPCVAMQALPRDLWRPLLVHDGGAVRIDADDMPRFGIGAGVSRDAPGVPDWWRDPRSVLTLAERNAFREGDLIDVGGRSYRVMRVNNAHTLTIEAI